MKELSYAEFIGLKAKAIIDPSMELNYYEKTKLYDIIYDLPKFLSIIGFIPKLGEEIPFITKIVGEILLLSTVDNNTHSIFTVSKTLGTEFLFTSNEVYYTRNDMLFLI